jgi:LPS-assembly protein
VRFDYYSESFSLFGQIQDYQTIDDDIQDVDEPYRRLPQFLVAGRWPMPLGLRIGIEGEIVNFDRNVGVTGWRMNAAPIIDLPIVRPGWFVTPAVEFDFTRYDLRNTLPGAATTPTRNVPIASLDTGMFLERTMKNSDRIQTIEPRLLYVSIPFRDQDSLPVFDTISPDLNLVQLYRKNRFVGVDRIGDTDQLSIGITTRILDNSSGKELMSATIGQTRYFGDRQVTLPGSNVPTTDASDYIAQLSFLLLRNVNFDFGHQWGAGIGDTTRTEARLQYRPANNKVLNLGYRFRRDSLEQGDISWSWPVSTRWNIVGRYNYSFVDREALEEFVGLEYESCCWGLRLVARRYISTRDGTRDSSVGLQLVLKGMTSVGTAADKLLERGILGYSADLR